MGKHDQQNRERPRRSKSTGSYSSTRVYYPGVGPKCVGLSVRLPVDGSRRTLKLRVAQYVVMDGVTDDHFDFQLQNCCASVLIVLMDTIHTTEKTQLREAQSRRAQLMVRLFQQKDI